MRISKKQLAKIIKEYIYSSDNRKLLNEADTVTVFAIKEFLSSCNVSEETAGVVVAAAEDFDDYADYNDVKKLDDWLADHASALAGVGMFSSGTLATAATAFSVGMLVLSAYSIIPKALIATIDNLKTVEGFLRNQHKAYSGLGNATGQRIITHGLNFDDFDIEQDDGFSELARRMQTAKDYTNDDIITQLAAGSIEFDESTGKVMMSQDSIAIKLLVDGVISNQFFEQVKGRFEKLKSKMDNATSATLDAYLELVLEKAKNIKADPNILQDAGKEMLACGFDVIFPGAKNWQGAIFNAAAGGVIDGEIPVTVLGLPVKKLYQMLDDHPNVKAGAQRAAGLGFLNKI